jgi:beta-ribofuranosylaminobenzene 5'-phosphate synthase
MMKMGKIRIETGARIHFGLLDLTGDTGRIDGSLGLSLSKPRMIITAESHDSIESTDRTELVKFAVSKLNNHFDLSEGLRVDVVESYEQHVGLGSSTQFLLSIGKAYCEINHLPGNPRELAKILGRGGTSGIGVAAFEKGGFILDAGHSFGPDQDKQTFLPSRAAEAPPAPVIFQSDFPSDWIIDLVVPSHGAGLSGQEEIDFFQTHCPIDPQETASIARVVLSLVIPGVIECDIGTFTRGINLLTTLGFKKREIDNQFNDLKLTLQNLNDITHNTVAIGMSSFGPALFLIWNSKTRSKYYKPSFSELETLLDKHGGNIYTTTSRNTGATINRLDSS